MSESGQASVASDVWTIRKILTWATDDFQRRGLESPRLEAELLLGHALGMTRIDLIVKSGQILGAGELDRIRELLRRRRSAEPTAYLLGQREFYGIPIRVDRRVLIPRPDTETLVQVAIERSRPRSAYGRALDLCTGSGCVAIAFAKHRTGWSMLGVDISEEALQVAENNALRVGNIWGLAWLRSNLFEELPAQRFDLITANPPYIPSEDLTTLDAGIRDFEPQLALDGGPDGLHITRRIVHEAPDWLEPNGAIAIEIGLTQAAAVTELLSTRGFVDVACNRDYGGRDRVISGRWPVLSP
jgi:release factor glutamine methyltransferase